MNANDIIQRNAECARRLLEAGAEIERLTALHVDAAARAELAQIDNARLREEDTVELAKMLLEIERLETALERIEQWSRAYPLTIFPEPNLKRARELLEAGGMTLDAISAHAMRHVVEGVGEIARRALASSDEPEA